MSKALKEFGDRVNGADWAVVYYAGHGMEMNGAAYLLPVDAKLEKDTHVNDETIALDRVLEKVEGARRLKLVILDACRNNPFVARMARSANSTRSVGKGLPALEPEGRCPGGLRDEARHDSPGWGRRKQPVREGAR